MSAEKERVTDLEKLKFETYKHLTTLCLVSVAFGVNLIASATEKDKGMLKFGTFLFAGATLLAFLMMWEKAHRMGLLFQNVIEACLYMLMILGIVIVVVGIR